MVNINFSINSYERIKRKRENKKNNKRLAKERFNDYKDLINIKHTFHSLTRSYERNGLTPGECIEDIMDNIKNIRVHKIEKNKCLILGQKSKYILSDTGFCITILKNNQIAEGFKDRVYKGKFFIVENNIKTESIIQVFKRRKIIKDN